MRGNKGLKILTVIIAISVIGQALGLWNTTDDENNIKVDSSSTALTTDKSNLVSEVSKTKQERSTDYVSYDKLQQLYIDVNSDMSYKEMLKLVKKTKLPYSEERYNGSRLVQVAFTEGCTLQKYKKEAGDYLEIYYDYTEANNSEDNLDKYTFATCVYNPYGSGIGLINHKHGHYFSYSKPGHYISDLGNDLGLDTNMSQKEQLDYFFNHKQSN